MRLLARSLCVLLIVGCNEVTTPTTAPLEMTVQSFGYPPFDRIPLEGAQLCETDATNCVATDESGRATIELPFDQEVSFTVTKEGYTSDLIAVVIPPSGSPGNVLTVPPARWAKDQHDRVDSPYPMRGTGTISMELAPEFAGATFELIEATAKPFYWDENAWWSLDLTETTSVGKGGFAEVTPGVFHVEFGGTAENCVPGWGWPGDPQKGIRYPVQEGYITIATAICAAP